MYSNCNIFIVTPERIDNGVLTYDCLIDVLVYNFFTYCVMFLKDFVINWFCYVFVFLILFCLALNIIFLFLLHLIKIKSQIVLWGFGHCLLPRSAVVCELASTDSVPK